MPGQHLDERGRLRSRHLDLDFKASGADQGGIYPLRIVTGTDHHNTFMCGKAVNLSKECICNRSPPIVPFAFAITTFDGVDLIDENNRRRLSACLCKTLPNCPDNGAKMTVLLRLPVSIGSREEAYPSGFRK